VIHTHHPDATHPRLTDAQNPAGRLQCGLRVARDIDEDDVGAARLEVNGHRRDAQADDQNLQGPGRQEG